jgi:chaperone protein dnaK
MNKVQVGIDLGTTNTLACCRVKGKLKLIKFQGGTMLPSVLYVEETPDGSIKEIVGKAAKIKGDEDPDNCIRSSKTYIGLTGSNKKIWECHGKKYTPTDVAARILREVHDKVRSTYNLDDEDVVQAVITIPAYFTSTQSDETKRAGEMAGMEVVRIITEPVAAAVSAAEDVEGKIFVVDLGGGTFDVSVLDIGEKYQTLEIGGERRLGGDDFDDRVVQYLLKFIEGDLHINLSSLEASGLDYDNYYLMMSKIRRGAIELKEALSEEDEYELIIPDLFEYGQDKKEYNFSFEMERDEFDELCRDLYERIIKVIDETVTKSKKFKKEELKKVFLVGGSCYIPKIQNEVERYFGIESDSSRDRATQVAMGAGKIADAWNGFVADKNHVDPFDVKLEDIISHSMGVKIVGKNGENEYSEILSEGTTYPCVHKGEYKTACDNQESVVIEVYEKTDSDASDFIERNEDAYDFYGSFVLSGIKPAPAGTTPIDVTFDYDQSRTLHVTAEDKKNNIVQTVELHKGESVQDNNSNVSPTDFFILLDVSGSMSGNRIEEAKRACVKLVQETLDLTVHKLGLITFGTRVDKLCGLTGNKNELMLSIDRVSINGSTNMDGAIEKATNELIKSENKKAVILITDGDPDSTASTDHAAQNARNADISIATIGVQRAKKSYLRSLSNDDSLCFMVDNLDKLSDTFGQAVKNLLSK